LNSSPTTSIFRVEEIPPQNSIKSSHSETNIKPGGGSAIIYLILENQIMVAYHFYLVLRKCHYIIPEGHVIPVHQSKCGIKIPLQKLKIASHSVIIITSGVKKMLIPEVKAITRLHLVLRKYHYVIPKDHFMAV
jgi:hypothetical protein